MAGSKWLSELEKALKKLNKPYIWTSYVLFCLGCEIGLACLDKFSVGNAALPPMIAAVPLLIWAKIALQKKENEEAINCHDEFIELMKYAESISKRWGNAKIGSRIVNPEFNAEKDNLIANIEELYTRRKCSLEAIDRILKRSNERDLFNSSYQTWGNILTAAKESLAATRDNICPKSNIKEGNEDD